MNQVRITTGTRLHFGLLCGPSENPWHYGGIGLMLEQPGWKFEMAAIDSVEDEFQASEHVTQRAARCVSDFRELHPELPRIRMIANQEVDFHTGLGSGTQLTLALGTACYLLSGNPRAASSRQLAADFGRSRRSAIGTFGFDRGGFIVDEGRSSEEITKIRFPEEWRMVLLTPVASAGLSGDPEEAFFTSRDLLSAETILEFDQLVRNRIVPSLESADFDRFHSALAEYGDAVGQYYASAQGGIFSNQTIREVIAHLAGHGITGAVQSSWGPTVCIPAANQQAAQAMESLIAAAFSPTQLRVTIASGMNTGASIVSSMHDDYRSFG